MIERSALQPFDVGVALHACGNATDHAIARCVAAGAAFVVSPCCIGKLKFSLAGGRGLLLLTIVHFISLN
jgi:hypothetical protein